MDWPWKPVFNRLSYWFSLCLQAALRSDQRRNHAADEREIRGLLHTAKPSSTDIPIGAGDVIHVDVFDVPNSRAISASAARGILAFPSSTKEFNAAGVTPFQLEQTIQEESHREWTGLSSAGFRLRQRAKQPARDGSRGGGAPDDISSAPSDDSAGGLGKRRGHLRHRGNRYFDHPPEPSKKRLSLSPKLPSCPTPILECKRSGFSCKIFSTLGATFNIQVYGGELIERAPGWYCLCDGWRCIATRRIRDAESRRTDHAC